MFNLFNWFNWFKWLNRFDSVVAVAVASYSISSKSSCAGGLQSRKKQWVERSPTYFKHAVEPIRQIKPIKPIKLFFKVSLLFTIDTPAVLLAVEPHLFGTLDAFLPAFAKILIQKRDAR
jgi:hypothetical protein